MKRINLLALILAVVLLVSCCGKPTISQKIERDFLIGQTYLNTSVYHKGKLVWEQLDSIEKVNISVIDDRYSQAHNILLLIDNAKSY